MTQSSLASLTRFDDISVLGNQGAAAVPVKKRQVEKKISIFKICVHKRV